MMKNILHENDEIWSKNILHQRTLNGPGTIVGTSRDLSDSFHKILLMKFRILLFKIFGTFRVKMMKVGRTFFVDGILYNKPGILAWPFRDLSDNCY